MKKFCKTIIFSRIPLTKYFRYKNEFQIYPCDLEGTPQSEFQKHYPVLLEYWIDDSEIVCVPEVFKDLESTYEVTALMITKVEKIINLLSVISNHLFFRMEDFEGRWGMVVDGVGQEKINDVVPQWCLPMYHWSSIPKQLKIDNLSDVNYEHVIQTDHKRYFTYAPNLDDDTTREITFPNTSKLILDVYYELNEMKQGIIDTAISHCISSFELRNNKKTLSLVAAFTAIETMVNLENIDFTPSKCEICGQAQFKVTQKYREYLLKYIGNSQSNKKKFNSYYNFRSKIVHTGQQFKTERLFSDVSKEDQEKELVTQIEILQLSKLSILNYLLNIYVESQKKKK